MKVTMTTMKNTEPLIDPQQSGEPPIGPDGAQVAMEQLNIEDNDVTMVNVANESDEEMSSPKAREKILRDLTISIPSQATKIPKMKGVLPNKRPLLSKDLKFEIPDKKLELKGDDGLLINLLEEQVNQLKATGLYNESFLIKAVKQQVAKDHMVKITPDGQFILHLDQLFATMRAMNDRGIADLQTLVDDKLKTVHQLPSEPYREYQSRLISAFSDVLEAHGKKANELSAEISKNKRYLIKMLFRGMKSALNRYMLHHECQPETAEFQEMLGKARNFERAEQSEREAELGKLHSYMGLNNEQVQVIDSGSQKNAPVVKECKYKTRCYKVGCKFQHPAGWTPAKKRKTPYDRPEAMVKKEPVDSATQLLAEYLEIRMGKRCGKCFKTTHGTDDCYLLNSKNDFDDHLIDEQELLVMAVNELDFVDDQYSCIKNTNMCNKINTGNNTSSNTSLQDWNLVSQNLLVEIRPKRGSDTTFNVFAIEDIKIMPECITTYDTGLKLPNITKFEVTLEPSMASIKNHVNLVPLSFKGEDSLVLQVHNKTKRAIVWRQSYSLPIAMLNISKARRCENLLHIAQDNRVNTAIPIITMTINKTDIPVLVDTGAMRSCISTDTALRLSAPSAIRDSLIMLQGAGQNQLQVKGAITLSISIGTKASDQEFIVINNLTRPCILGFPAIQTLSGQINAKESYISFTLKGITRHYSLLGTANDSWNQSILEIKDGLNETLKDIKIGPNVNDDEDRELQALIQQYSTIFAKSDTTRH